MGLRTRIFLFFAALACGAAVLLGLGLWFGYHRGGSPEMANAFIRGAAVAILGVLALTGWIWFLFDTHIARPIETIASAIRVRASADVTDDIDPASASYLGDLAAAASLATARLADARTSLAQAVARETAQLVADKSKLENLLGDVPPAVLLCTGSHALVFYNSVAQHMLNGPKVPVCLGRGVFDYLDEDPIREAHRSLMDAEVPDGVVEFPCRAHVCDRRLIGRMRLVHDNDGDTGAYVVTLRDVTGEYLACSRRNALIEEVFARTRASLSRLDAELREAGDGELMVTAAQLTRELKSLQNSLRDLETRFDLLKSGGWPMVATDSRELARAVRKSLEEAGVTVDASVTPLVMHCNAADITALLRHVGLRLFGAGADDRLQLAIGARTGAAEIRLRAPGRRPPADFMRRLKEPVDGAHARRSAEAILEAHAAEIEVEEEAEGIAIGFSLRPAQTLRQLGDESSHSVVYDFDLLSRIHYDRIADAKLANLTYVVFDTETTGLFPERGDEIVQIAAVRLVNCKRVKGESFETLVNPGRPIPRSASDIHGVTDAMVADAPNVQEAIARFHKFAEGAVLVAHNAPFDMEFLRRRERELGIRFDNPVLDTVLISAVVFGARENHTLDALAERLSIAIPEEDRHTAMGDAVATAEAFIRLKAILVERGVESFGQVLDAVRRHRRLLKDLND